MASASALGALLLKSPLFRDSSLTLHGQYTRPLTFLEFVSGIALRLLGLAGLEADEQEEGKKGGGGGGGAEEQVTDGGYGAFVFINSSCRGPFLPVYASRVLHWAMPFLSRLTNKVCQ
jgi:hypothetical protein